MIDHSDISEILHAAGADFDLPPRGLAKRVGIAPTTLARWTSGEGQPGVRLFDALAQIGRGPSPAEIRDAIREAREDLGLTQAQAAEEIGITVELWGGVERELFARLDRLHAMLHVVGLDLVRRDNRIYIEPAGWAPDEEAGE